MALSLYSDRRYMTLEDHVDGPCQDILVFCELLDIDARIIGLHGSVPYVGVFDKQGNYLGQIHLEISQIGYNDEWEFSFNPTGLFSKDLEILGIKETLNGWKTKL